MTNKHSMEYTVEQIQPDEAGTEFFLSHYKPFRLTALKTDPECEFPAMSLVITVVQTNAGLTAMDV